ncbi:MAG TPA: transposase [Saprospiraceae bacterium]|nr:transposase [Saprospiraceae bacterium]
MTQRKVVPKEIKNEILAKVKGGEKVADLARHYGISDKSVYPWLHQDTGDPIISIIQYNRLKRENEELKKLIGELSLKLSLGEKNRSG